MNTLHLLRPGEAAKYVGGYDRLKRLSNSGKLPFVQEPGSTQNAERIEATDANAVDRAYDMLSDRAEHEGPDFNGLPLISRLRMVVFDLTKLADSKGISMERLLKQCRTFNEV